jgi:acetyl-CoA carboxylase carboxyl transferase beta subunit
MLKETCTLFSDDTLFLVWDRDSEGDSLFISPKYNRSNHIKNSIDSSLDSKKCCLDSSDLTRSENYLFDESYDPLDDRQPLLSEYYDLYDEIYDLVDATSQPMESYDLYEEYPEFFDESYDKFFIPSNILYDDLTGIPKYRHLWLQCENCSGLNYKYFLKSQLHICEQCEYHFKMSSSERIDLFIDPNTWYPMNEAIISRDPIEFHSEEDPYKDRINYYQRKTGLTEAVQTGIGKINGIPVAIGIMDSQFLGGSMGSAVGEKITRLIEYATKSFLPLIIVSASGGARMQEGSLSLMQMAKISSALHDYKSNYKSNRNLLYISILTSPTTGGVTASFAMLGDIIIAEPNAYIAFAGKRVIEETLNTTVPEGSQETEYLFEKGLFDSIVPRNLLKGILSELLNLHRKRKKVKKN